jgi:peptidoglycan/LPS O-acetylase OafA/YrhL
MVPSRRRAILSHLAAGRSLGEPPRLPYSSVSGHDLPFISAEMLSHLAVPNHAQEWSYGELPTHCDGLLCGAIAAILVRGKDLHILVRKSRALFFLSFLGMLLLALHYGGFGYHNAGMTGFVYPLLAVFLTCILVRTIHAGSVFSRLGRTRVLRFFGKYSYGMYVYHALFLPVVSNLLPRMQRLLHSRTWGGVAYVFGDPWTDVHRLCVELPAVRATLAEAEIAF